MGTQSKYLIAALVSLGVIAAAAVLVVLDYDGDAQWRIAPAFSTGKVNFTVRQSSTFGQSSHSHDVPVESLRGFSLSMLASSGPVKFEYVADAGRLLCQGRFLLGAGSGTYTFVPDRSFAAALQEMGYDAPDDQQLFSLLALDIGREFAREIRDAGLHASTSDLIRLKTHGVDLGYVRAARQAGYQDFSADDYVRLRTHGVEIGFLRDLKAAGYDLRAAEIADLSMHGIDSGFMRDLKSYGLKPVAADLSPMRMHGVTPEYLRGLKDAGYEQLGAEEVNQLLAHGVETEFVQSARRLGYDFTADELAQLRMHGVDSHYLKHLKDTGMRDLDARQIAQLRMAGVD